MSPILAQFLTMLMVKILNPDKDTKEVQAEIIDNPDMVEAIAIREATDVIIKGAGKGTNAELVADVIEVAKTGSLKTVEEKHKGNILSNLVDLVFGWMNLNK